MNLIKKELTSIFCSPIGLFFSASYLILVGILLWLFAGSYNILDSGYTSLENLFAISSFLLIILIPALTMRSYSEEKRNKTFDILLSRPIRQSSIYVSKLIAYWLFVVIVLSTTTIYIYTIYQLGSPIGNIDLQAVIASYVSLFILSFIFCSVGVFASSLSKNQMIALLISIIINFALFYGFELSSFLASSTKSQAFIASLGLSSHYNLMQRGVIEISNLLIAFNYSLVFYILFILVSKQKKYKQLIAPIIILLSVNILSIITPNTRFDLTADKRYSLSDYSKTLLKKSADDKQSIRLNIFLEGELNPSFQRLQTATKDMVNDMNRYSNNSIQTSFVSPQIQGGTPEEVYSKMEQMDMRGIVLNEVSRDGKSSQRVIYPYAQMISGSDTLKINLLKNVAGNTAEENINAAIENLEFEFIDAIRLFNKKEPEAIAFIEGHQEIDRTYVLDAEEILSKYFFINRGEIGNDVSVLDAFKVIIIAGPQKRYSDTEKYVIDQYIMNGGRVLWLIDGVYFSQEDLAKNGKSATMKNESNLDDLLFSYGVRVNPSLIQDMQCSQILLNYGDENTQSTVIPWYYSPLLMPSGNNLITKDISNVKSAFVSPLEFVGNAKNLEKSILLTSSYNSHIINVPEIISFDNSEIQAKENYFTESFLPAAVSLKGKFTSAFTNRLRPDSIAENHQQLSESKPGKMIVIGSSDLIRSSLIGQNENTQILPMGYDRIGNKQYGNRDFIVNAVNWLANDDEWMSLRSKQQKIRLLDKNRIYENRTLYTVINILSPLAIMAIIISLVYFRRKWKHERK